MFVSFLWIADFEEAAAGFEGMDLISLVTLVIFPPDKKCLKGDQHSQECRGGNCTTDVETKDLQSWGDVVMPDF